MLDLFCMRTLIRLIVVVALFAIGHVSFSQNLKSNPNPILDELIEFKPPDENKIYHIEHSWELKDDSYVVIQEIRVTQKRKLTDGKTIVDVETIGKPIIFVIKGKIPSTFDEFFDGSLFISDKVVYFYNLSSEKSRPLQVK